MERGEVGPVASYTCKPRMILTRAFSIGRDADTVWGHNGRPRLVISNGTGRGVCRTPPAIEEEAALIQREVIAVARVTRTSEGHGRYAIIVSGGCTGDVLGGINGGLCSCHNISVCVCVHVYCLGP